jgi:hypothetical protein
VTDERLVMIAMPALVSILLDRERAKGSPLTEAEVMALRDEAECVAVPRDVAARMAEQRGYDDIDLEKAWEGWLAIRPSLGLDGA